MKNMEKKFLKMSLCCLHMNIISYKYEFSRFSENYINYKPINKNQNIYIIIYNYI